MAPYSFFVELVKDGEQQIRIFVGGMHSVYHSTAGSAVIECQYGQDVSVRMNRTGTVGGGKASMFTGFLLYET